MKGVILAGGLGTRLLPLTKITNKHLLPIYNQPMIYYPIQTLVRAGIDELVIVTGGHYAGDFLNLLGNGKDFGLRRINYAYQEGEGGIADALRLAREFTGNDKIIVVLGDNILEKDITAHVQKFRQQEGAKILLKEVPDPQRFGVAEIDTAGKVINIIEKPKQPKSNLAVIGVYMYDHHVYDVIHTLRPSERGELEITDVNNAYLRMDKLSADVIDGWWTDAGTFTSLYRASRLVAEKVEPKLKEFWF
ncbi:NTP transferase domain-containing protein [candidate division KSB1 bacterium]|nr:NTP transferase domain-containing protein [candidate division KSB1 bacterium]